MPRTHFTASALPLALLAAMVSACAGGPRPAPASPAPVAVAPEPPAPPLAEPAPERVDEGFAIDRVRNGTVGRELLGTASYDLPVEANQWVASEIGFLVNQRRDVVGRWMERGERYAAFVQETFAAAGIPRDLHHLAMVESGYQPTVRSRAGAVGMWQFMPATGRGMGLRIDDVVDERMDPVRSTRAAARHLRDLNRDFGGDWALAAAAYNAGAGRISRGLASFGANGFWDLAERGNLAQETRKYVPRLFAVTIIAKDPARFGYARPAGVVQRFEFDSMQVDLPTPLSVLARAGNVPVGTLQDLNPHLFRGVTPAYYWVWVPKGNGGALQTAYQTGEFRRRGGFANYTLRRGEDASSVAFAAGITVDQLRDLNLGTVIDRIGRGDRVRLYADAARALAARPVEREERLASRDESDDPDSRPSRRASASNDDDFSSSSTRTRRASDDESSSSTRRTGAGDDEPSSTRRSRAADDEASSARRTRVANDESSSTRTRRASDNESSSTRRTRVADDESSSTRRSERVAESSTRRRASDDDARPARRSTDSESRSTARRSTSDEPEAPRRRSSDDGGTVRRASASREESGRVATATQRKSGSGDDDAPARTRRASSEEGDSRALSTRARMSDRNDALALVLRHTVEAGETLFSIARRYGLTPAQLRDANDLGASATLRAGQRLRVPQTATRTASTSERRRADSDDAPRTSTRESAQRTRMAEHVVKDGETLWSIARRYETTVTSIRSANDMDADSILQPGQKLRIPRPASTEDR